MAQSYDLWVKLGTRSLEKLGKLVIIKTKKFQSKTVPLKVNLTNKLEKQLFF